MIRDIEELDYLNAVVQIACTAIAYPGNNLTIEEAMEKASSSLCKVCARCKDFVPTDRSVA